MSWSFWDTFGGFPGTNCSLIQKIASTHIKNRNSKGLVLAWQGKGRLFQHVSTVLFLSFSSLLRKTFVVFQNSGLRGEKPQWAHVKECLGGRKHGGKVEAWENLWLVTSWILIYFRTRLGESADVIVFLDSRLGGCKDNSRFRSIYIFSQPLVRVGIVPMVGPNVLPLSNEFSSYNTAYTQHLYITFQIPNETMKQVGHHSIMGQFS